MTINEAPLDRAIRGAGGLALLATPLVGIDISFFWLGIVPLATAIVGVCPLYKALGLSSVTPDSYQHRKDGIEIKGAPPREAHA